MRDNTSYPSFYKLNTALSADKNSIELKSNVIVVPHNVFNQWTTYIETHTTLSAIYIARRSHYTSIGTTKAEIINITNSAPIILIKSTMYKGFADYMNTILSHTYTDNILNVDSEANIVTDILEIKQQLGLLYYRLEHPTSIDLEDPHTLSNDFVSTVEKFTSILNNSANSWDNLEIYNCHRQTEFKSYIYGYYFQRVIVDEVDSIKIPSFPYIYSKQIWYISSSINNIMYPHGKEIWDDATHSYKSISTGINGTGFLKDIISNMFSTYRLGTGIRSLRSLFSIVKSNNAFIQNSIRIPDPIIRFIECLTPKHLYILKDTLNLNVLKAFNAGDSSKAIELLGCDIASSKSIVEQCTKKIETQLDEWLKKKAKLVITLNDANISLDNIKSLYEITKSESVLSGCVPNVHTLSLLDEQKISILKNRVLYTSRILVCTNKIKSCHTKIISIKERISNTETKECPICTMALESAGITPCCHNSFCMECITNALIHTKVQECPICRSVLHLQDMHIVSNDIHFNKTKTHLLSKTETLLKLISPGKRIMIFSEFEDSLSTIKALLDVGNIKYAELKGAPSSVDKKLDKFRSLETSLLLLNAKYFGAGLNVQCADEIIIFHRMSTDLEAQVIGRAQRIGRSSPLIINYLCYANEYPK